MSTDLLREAAAKVREENVVRGAATFCACGDSPDWFDRSICPEPCGSMHYVCEVCTLIKGWCAVALSGRAEYDRRAASWLAVADWLDATAEHSEKRGLHLQTHVGASALAVATAYLGRDS